MTAEKPLRHPAAASSYLSPAAIVLVWLIISTCSGCHVLGIPSYRTGSGEHLPSNAGLGSLVCESGCLGDSCGAVASDDLGADEYRAGLLPPIPVPMWFANWKAKRAFKEALPEAPQYPRFHPLPTRPMFSPKPGTQPAYFSNAAQADAHQLADGMIVGESVEMAPPPQFPPQTYQYGQLPGIGSAAIEQVQPIPGETIPSPN